MRLRRLAACGALLLIAAAPRPAMAADAVTLSVTPGLAGIARPGRWMPLSITIENNGSDLAVEMAVEMTVQWGRTRVRRRLDLPAPSRKRVEVFIRTGDVRDAVVVRLERDGQTIAEATAPVRVVPYDTVVTLCAGEPIGPAACTATIPFDAFPRSFRALDAADDVMVDSASLDADGRAALQWWSELRRLERDGNNAPATGDVPQPATAGNHALAPLTSYAIVLGVAFASCAFARRRHAVLYPVLVAAIAAGSVGAVRAGRSSPIVVHHASLMQGFAGLSGAMITSRAVAEFPGTLDGPLVLSASEASIIDRSASAAPFEDRLDADGRPVISTRAGLGRTAPFALEALADASVLTYTPLGTTARVSNASPHDLRDCHLPPGSPVSSVERLRPGASVDLPAALEGPDPVMTCTLDALPLTFSHPHSEVVAHGTTLVVLHLPPSHDES